MPGPSLQAEIINVLKSNQEKEDDDVRRMFWQMFPSSSSAVCSLSMSWSTSMSMSMSMSNQEEEEEDEDVLADVSEQQRGRGWCAAKFFQHFPASPDI